MACVLTIAIPIFGQPKFKAKTKTGEKINFQSTELELLKFSSSNAFDLLSRVCE